MELAMNTRVFTKEDGLLGAEHETYVVGLMNMVFHCVHPDAKNTITSVAEGKEFMRRDIGMQMKKVVRTDNGFLNDMFDACHKRVPFKGEVPRSMLHGCKVSEDAECITSRGLMNDKSIGVQQHGAGVYVTHLMHQALKYAGVTGQYTQNRSTVISFVHLQVLTGHTPGTRWDVGVAQSTNFKPGVYSHGNRSENPHFICLMHSAQAAPLGYFELESCGLEFLNMKIVDTRASNFRNEVISEESYEFRYMSVEQRKSQSDKVEATSVGNAHSLNLAAAGGTAIGSVLPRVRIKTIGRQKMSVIAAGGGAAGGGAAGGGAAGGIFPGASFLPGKSTVYPPMQGITYNDIDFKEGNKVTVKAVTGVEYRHVLNTMDPKLNTAEIKLVYSMGGDNFVMVEMLDSLRKSRVQDANANAALLSIGPLYKQAITHMKVNLKDIEPVPPVVTQVGATAALLLPAPATTPGVVLANAMQTAMVGLFANSPQNTAVGNVQSSVVTHICSTSKCTRFTWDGEPGHCCRTCCSSGGSKHGVDCSFKDDAIDDYLLFTKKQKQQGGSHGGAGA